MYKKNPQQSLILATAIHNESVTYGLDWKMFVSILNQESSLRRDPQNCLNVKTACTGDFGIGQVRKKVWDKVEGMSFDENKLLTDVAYAVQASAKILNHYKQKYSKKEMNWFTRYHSGTPEYRSKYMRALNKSYAKVNGFMGKTEKELAKVKPFTLESSKGLITRLDY